MRKTTELYMVGVVAFLAAMACQSAMDATAKWLTSSYHVGQIMFFRNLFGLLPLLVVLRRGNIRKSLSTRNLPLHILRGAITVSCGLLFFLSLKYLGLAEATAIFFVGPLIMALLSAPLLGDVVTKYHLVAIVLGFVGAAIILDPSSESINLAGLIALGAAFFYALSMILFRHLSRTETPQATLLYGGLSALVISALFLPFVWYPPLGIDMVWFLLIGLFGGFSTYLIAIAYKYISVPTAATLDYSTLIWAIIFGLLIWGEFPATNIWIGASLVIASGLFITHWQGSQKNNE